MNTPICDYCNRNTVAYVPKSKPTAAEYYCEGCRKSKPMTDPEHIDYWRMANIAR